MAVLLRRNLLVLLVLALATQWLAIGLEKLFLVQDIPVVIAYQQALAVGKEQAFAAVVKATGNHPADFVIAKYWHELYGTLLALALGCLATGYLVWRKRISWLVILLLPVATVAIARSGLLTLIKQGLLVVFNQATLPVSLQTLFGLLGLVGIGGFLLLVAAAFRLAPPTAQSPKTVVSA